MDKKKLWYVLGVVVVLVVVAVAWRGGGSPSDSEESLSPSVSVGASANVSPTAAVKPRVAPTPVLPNTYGDAVAQFSDRRIQFDMYCQANPVNNTYKNGSQIMLDNRSGDARIISLNGVQYNLAGYGWKIVTLNAKTLPATWAVDCGSAKNVSKVLIQK